jgi:hypothetical protein
MALAIEETLDGLIAGGDAEKIREFKATISGSDVFPKLIQKRPDIAMTMTNPNPNVSVQDTREDPTKWKAAPEDQFQMTVGGLRELSAVVNTLGPAAHDPTSSSYMGNVISQITEGLRNAQVRRLAKPDQMDEIIDIANALGLTAELVSAGIVQKSDGTAAY